MRKNNNKSRIIKTKINKMSFTLYLIIQIPLITALFCLVAYQTRIYYKQKKLLKEMIENQNKDE